MGATTDNVNRVKLPKSFLAVNLSESHTFHKKDDTEERTILDEATQTAEVTGEGQAQADDLLKTEYSGMNGDAQARPPPPPQDST
jgi:hypothetical protein